MAIGLMMAGGLKPLQTISLAAAFPFIFIMIGACLALLKALRQERREKNAAKAKKQATTSAKGKKDKIESKEVAGTK